ncbi:hypothetical protein [Deefgea rivuli]|uniref:hypothetical protein n=1 Tax=Deefgea rivuli TaxID=400948 RepID=UPI0004812571|nr:hypothetical protein [Deefgea rivuli]
MNFRTQLICAITTFLASSNMIWAAGDKPNDLTPQQITSRFQGEARPMSRDVFTKSPLTKKLPTGWVISPYGGTTIFFPNGQGRYHKVVEMNNAALYAAYELPNNRLLLITQDTREGALQLAAFQVWASDKVKPELVARWVGNNEDTASCMETKAHCYSTKHQLSKDQTRLTFKSTGKDADYSLKDAPIIDRHSANF